MPDTTRCHYALQLVSQTIALPVFEAFAAAALAAMDICLDIDSGPAPLAASAVTRRPCESKLGVPFEKYVCQILTTDYSFSVQVGSVSTKCS